MEHASEIRGFLVVAREEGEQLGHLSEIYIDPAGNGVAALGYSKRRLGGQRFFVAIEEVQSVGTDVVLITSKRAAREVTDAQEPPGYSLKDLQGAWVSTMEGRHLGTLVDLDFGSDWKITELVLSDDKQLTVDAAEIKIGDDILVPASYAQRVQAIPAAERGVLRRLFGREALDDTKKVLRRALRRDAERPSK